VTPTDGIWEDRPQRLSNPDKKKTLKTGPGRLGCIVFAMIIENVFKMCGWAPPKRKGEEKKGKNQNKKREMK
jgi:hypothetical protein